MPFPNPPAAPPGVDMTFGAPDTTQFNTNMGTGIIVFNFVYKGAQLSGQHLTIRINAKCKDANYKFIPWKDCRPVVDLQYIKKFPSSIDHVGYDSWYIFNATLTEPNIQSSDEQCKNINLEVDIDARTVIPDLNGHVDLWFGKGGGFSARPLAKWVIPLRYCCKSCSLSCIVDPPQED